ncbi:hypothetical protein PIB30_045138 [Stylosanthes scabra]|uniref:Uncharacterized protein n=1 Tax=Stylosanthes scabra TaxID=79078 RepID=A0ABU6TH29_9FABA|nr:hypothetical protein [Stylosanthes scabra]
MREVAKRTEAQISHLTDLMTKFATQMLPSTSTPPPPPNPSPLPSQPLPNPKGGINIVEKRDEKKEKKDARTEWLIELIAEANAMKSTHQVQLKKEDKDERKQGEEAKARLKKLKGLRSSPPHVKKKRKDPAKKKVKIRKSGGDNSKEKKEEEEEKRRFELKCKSVEDLIGKLYAFKKVLHHNEAMTRHLVKDQSKCK